MVCPREVHLVPDFISDVACSAGAVGLPGRPPLAVPDGVSYLCADDAGALQLTTAPASTSEELQFLLEPIWSGGQPQLLLLSPAGSRVRLNGRPAPQLCVLGEQDQFQPNEHHLLHVAIYNRPDVGRPGADRVGSECPVCRTEIEADSRIYTCLHCRTAIHVEDEETPLETRLECAVGLSACPVCQKSIVMTAGYASKPELYS